MKKLIVIVTTVLFVSGYTVSAQMMGQNNNQNPQRGMMMQSGMMNRGGMMNQGGMMQNQDNN